MLCTAPVKRGKIMAIDEWKMERHERMLEAASGLISRRRGCQRCGVL